MFCLEKKFDGIKSARSYVDGVKLFCLFMIRDGVTVVVEVVWHEGKKSKCWRQKSKRQKRGMSWQVVGFKSNADAGTWAKRGAGKKKV